MVLAHVLRSQAWRWLAKQAPLITQLEERTLGSSVLHRSGGVVAVAVVIENAGGGGTQAAPVAAQVIEATVRSPVGRRREEAAVQSRKAVYL